MAPLLDQLLFPQRLLTRALNDLHRMAEAAASIAALARDLRPAIEPLPDWMNDTATTLRSIRDQAAGARAAIESVSEDVTILRDEFGRSNDEIARLREVFGPELEALRTSAAGLEQELRQICQLIAALKADADQIGGGVIDQMRALRGDVGALAREADEISEVVEPLQGATERVGKVADRLPGGG
jgi:predicted  nucleic acid-binding Zn-ribbon protein